MDKFEIGEVSLTATISEVFRRGNSALASSLSIGDPPSTAAGPFSVARVESYLASMDLIASGRMFGPSSGAAFCGREELHRAAQTERHARLAPQHRGPHRHCVHLRRHSLSVRRQILVGRERDADNGNAGALDVLAKKTADAFPPLPRIAILGTNLTFILPIGPPSPVAPNQLLTTRCKVSRLFEN
jgi:hypothetical protein